MGRMLVSLAKGRQDPGLVLETSGVMRERAIPKVANDPPTTAFVATVFASPRLAWL